MMGVLRENAVMSKEENEENSLKFEQIWARPLLTHLGTSGGAQYPLRFNAFTRTTVMC